MTEDTEPDVDDSAWFRNFYIRNGYKDVEKWVRRACEASNAKYVPPVTRYEQEPAEFWELWECEG